MSSVGKSTATPKYIAKLVCVAPTAQLNKRELEMSYRGRFFEDFESLLLFRSLKFLLKLVQASDFYIGKSSE